MSLEGPLKLRALLFGVFGAVIGSAIYYAFMAVSGIQFALVAMLSGVLAGYSARWFGRARTTVEGVIVGLTAAAFALIADVVFYFVILYGDPEFSLLGLLLQPLTIVFYALTFIGALLIVIGFEPISVLTFDPQYGGNPVSPATPFQGVAECPNCGSLQTEAKELDMENDQPTVMICNSCDHTWPVASSPRR